MTKAIHCSEGVTDARPAHQPGRGGSIPASELHFNVGQDDEAFRLVRTFHYSRRWPSAVQFVGTLCRAGGLFGQTGPAVAAVVFSVPPTRWSEPVLELSRLVRDEATPGVPLSLLIRLACSRLKREGRWPLLVSFADWTQRHHGGVYQACGWRYAGMRDPRMDGLLIDGFFVTGRKCNHAYGSRSPDKVGAALGPAFTVAPHYDEGKHLYWRALSAEGSDAAARLKLAEFSYPKPGLAPAGGTP